MAKPMMGRCARSEKWFFAYSKKKQGFKADPKWKVGICLGKTEVQDAWVIGDGNRVSLSKSIRRVADASTKYIACYQGFTAYSWEYQQNWWLNCSIKESCNNGWRATAGPAITRGRRSCIA